MLFMNNLTSWAFNFAFSSWWQWIWCSTACWCKFEWMNTSLFSIVEVCTASTFSFNWNPDSTSVNKLWHTLDEGCWVNRCEYKIAILKGSLNFN